MEDDEEQNVDLAVWNLPLFEVVARQWRKKVIALGTIVAQQVGGTHEASYGAQGVPQALARHVSVDDNVLGRKARAVDNVGEYDAFGRGHVETFEVRVAEATEPQTVHVMLNKPQTRNR